MRHGIACCTVFPCEFGPGHLAQALFEVVRSKSRARAAIVWVLLASPRCTHQPWGPKAGPRGQAAGTGIRPASNLPGSGVSQRITISIFIFHYIPKTHTYTYTYTYMHTYIQTDRQTYLDLEAPRFPISPRHPRDSKCGPPPQKQNCRKCNRSLNQLTSSQ